MKPFYNLPTITGLPEPDPYLASKKLLTNYLRGE